MLAGTRARLVLASVLLAISGDGTSRAVVLHSGTEATRPTLSSVGVVAQSILGRYSVAGLSIGVSRGTRIEEANGYGKADTGERVHATGETVYRIASLTKEFTAAAIMQLVQQGRLHLDDHIDRYVPGLPYGSQVSIAELLNHTSGIVNFTALPYHIAGLPPLAGRHPARLRSTQMVRILARTPRASPREWTTRTRIPVTTCSAS